MCNTNLLNDLKNIKIEGEKEQSDLREKLKEIKDIINNELNVRNFIGYSNLTKL